MKANLFPTFVSQRERGVFDQCARACTWKGIRSFIQRSQWGIIAGLGVATILAEFVEHLGIVQNNNFFYYSEVVLITILLITSKLATSVSSGAPVERQEAARPAEPTVGTTELDEQLEQKVQAIQKQIARDLHDTLGQNISYLRLKLDYLAEKGGISIPGLEAEIRHMAGVANESYDLVRGTLAALQVKASNGLYALLAGHAQQVAERASIQIEINERGEPRPLSPGDLLQIFMIFREALSNIEKHACASRAGVEIEWREAGVLLTISDNGRGFDLTGTGQSDHYGLRFMRERAERLNGQFSIDSARGTGTRIIIRL